MARGGGTAAAARSECGNGSTFLLLGERGERGGVTGRRKRRRREAHAALPRGGPSIM